MKGSSSTLVATVVAVSSVAMASSSSVASDLKGKVTYSKGVAKTSKGTENDKFSPKFDGLSFIETLVTAHR